MHKLIGPAETLALNMARTNRAPSQWTEPERFDEGSLADQNELNRRFNSGEIEATVDRTAAVALDFFEFYNPASNDQTMKAEFVDEFASRKDGALFFMPWRKELWKFPNEDLYPSIRSSRYNPLITPDEQFKVRNKVTTLVGGLSIGSSIETGLVLAGIGDRHVIADFDRLSLTNTGRIHSRYDEIGGLKIDNVAISTSEINPYIEQVLIRNKLDEEALKQLGQSGIRPDIMFDAVDDFSAKAQMRQYAQAEKIPLVMITDLGERSMVDIENYASDPKALFNGRLPKSLIQKITDGNLTSADLTHIYKDLLGITNLSPRLMKSSVMKDEGEIAGVPQDGLIAGTGGNIGAFVARQILLGRSTKSGRYPIDLARILKLRRPDSFVEEASMIAGTLRHTYLGR